MARGRIRVGLALGTGGARGWCHIGAIRALEELGIDVHLVAGCSMGALVGAAHAAGMLDELEAWARDLNLLKLASMFDISLASGGLVEGREVERMFEQLGMPELIEELELPFTAVATELATGRERWLQGGRVVDAVRASIAIPGVFSPHRVGGRWLLDGGMVNPVPISVARAMGADVVIAVNPNARGHGHFWPPPPGRFLPSGGAVMERLAALLPGEAGRQLLARLSGRDSGGERHPGYADVLSASTSIMTEVIRRARLAADPADVLVEVELPSLMVLELHRAAEAIEAGRAATLALAGEIRAALAAA